MKSASDAVPDELSDDRKTLTFDVGLDGRGDVGQAVPFLHLLQALGESAFGRGDEPKGLGADPADGDGQGRVAEEAFVEGAEIQTDDIAVLQETPRGDAVDDLLIDRNADRGGIAAIALESRLGAELAGPLLRVKIEVAGPDAGPDEGLELGQDCRDDPATLAHGLELGRGLEGDHGHAPFPPGRPGSASRTRRTSATTAPAAASALIR